MTKINPLMAFLKFKLNWLQIYIFFNLATLATNNLATLATNIWLQIFGYKSFPYRERYVDKLFFYLKNDCSKILKKLLYE